jgi:hypothetical protein
MIDAPPQQAVFCHCRPYKPDSGGAASIRYFLPCGFLSELPFIRGRTIGSI